MPTVPDQIETLLTNDKLTQAITALEFTIRNTGRDVPARPSLTADILQNTELLTAHRGVLLVATKLATPAPQAAPGGKAMTQTELCHAVRNGSMTIEQALAARQKPAPIRLTKLNKVVS